jgi:anti-sigma regulatory factor (Ser/Thr protein kinase)
MSAHTVRPRLDVRLPADRHAAAAAREALDPVTVDLTPERQDDARLLVSELATNSIRHARLEGAGWVRLTVCVDEDTLRVEITDSGAGFEPPIDQTAEPGLESGRGLFLVDALSDRWGVDHKGAARTWFEMDLDR